MYIVAGVAKYPCLIGRSEPMQNKHFFILLAAVGLLSVACMTQGIT